MADACQILAGAELVELFTGHVSERDDERILLPVHLHHSGRGLESITPQQVISVDLAGRPLDGREPPSEVPIHTEIFDRRDDVVSVAHAHPTYATGLSIAQQPLIAAGLDASLFGDEVSVYDPGPKLLHGRAGAAELAKALDDRPALLLRGHGVVTVGESVAEATARMYLLERAAKLQTIAASVGDVVPFEDLEVDGGFMSESNAGFFDEVFAFLRREYVD